MHDALAVECMRASIRGFLAQVIGFAFFSKIPSEFVYSYANHGQSSYRSRGPAISTNFASGSSHPAPC
jgi:hypothetical protein